MPVVPGSTAGYILAGGRSARMGRDKALLPLGNKTLVQQIAAEVTAAAGSARIVGADFTALGIESIADLFPGFGPVGGIATALLSSPAEWNLIVACDMPEVRREHLLAILERASRGRAQAAVPRDSGGRVHPLCAVYRSDAAPVLEQAVRDGVHTVREVLSRLKTDYLPVEDESFLMNVNTPGEWATIAHGRE